MTDRQFYSGRSPLRSSPAVPAALSHDFFCFLHLTDRQLFSGPVPHPPRRLYVAPPPYTRTRGCAPGGSPIGWAVLLLTYTMAMEHGVRRCAGAGGEVHPPDPECARAQAGTPGVARGRWCRHRTIERGAAYSRHGPFGNGDQRKVARGFPRLLPRPWPLPTTLRPWYLHSQVTQLK